MNKEWAQVLVGDVLTERREKPSPEDLASGRVRIVSKISFSSGALELRSDSATKTGMILAYPGDLVVSGINAAKGAIAIYEKENVEPVAATIHYGAYTPNLQKTDLRYLWYFFRSQVFQRILEENIPGGIKTELKAKRFLPIPIPLPPLEEQRRIVARIEELETALGEARRLRKQSIEETKILWERAASRIFGEAFSQYPNKKLSDLVYIQGGGTPSKSNSIYWDGLIPWITPKDMKKRKLDDSLIHITEIATNQTAAKLIQAGSVLVVVRGMILAHTFPSGVLQVNASINQDMKALLPKGEVLPEFLCSIFWGLNKNFLEVVEKSTHDTRKLRTEKLLDVSIPIPPLSEQRRIVAYSGIQSGENTKSLAG